MCLAVAFLVTQAAHSAQRRQAIEPSPPRPNFIIILADDMGYSDASCYGNTAYQTPHIDQLASEGMRFSDFHSSGAVCSPTRTGLLTGRYQQRAGIPGVVYAAPDRNRHHGLHTHEVVFAESLQKIGYRSGIVGKWHLGYRKKFNPIHHGFDLFRGYVSGNVDYFSHVDGVGIYDWWDGDELIQEEGYTTHLITKHAVQFIEQNQDRPFCLVVAHETPHSPYQGPNDQPVRGVGQPKLRRGRKDIRNAYREMMQEMDKGVGQVVATVKRLGLAQRTFVFFFSDNGATRNGSNGPLRGFKGSLWEGGHRVPAVAWWPGTIQQGSVCAEPTICLDLMPTMLALAGTSVPKGHKLDGVNLVPVMLEGKTLGVRKLFWQTNRQRAIRQGPWKIVLNRSGQATLSLHNLEQDIGERRNLADQHPERVKAMLEAMEAWNENVADGATVQPSE